MSDTVVVGGGIIGLLTARYLAKAGREVTLIDKSELGRVQHGPLQELSPLTQQAVQQISLGSLG